VPPPPMDGRLGDAAPLSELIYPGAKTEIDIRNNDDGQVLQLTTGDSFAKVVNWYETKMKPEERVIMPDQQAILKSRDYQVIIRPDGQETKILLTQGDR
ncbi:MAG TPA: hypothetical protein VM870_03275, partial [Pyrinomonadaceae bacterium]|nr:hypothetical protein [Pyrinomonadaceae bacterium]